MIWIGLDPGNTGAMVALNERYNVVYAASFPLMNIGTSKTKRMMLDAVEFSCDLRNLLDREGAQYVVLEKAQAMPGQGMSSMFQYGRGFGMLEMALAALRVPYELVHPTRWQKAVLKGVAGRDTKARAIAVCRHRLPDLDLTPGRKRKPDEGLADAACMALYAMERRPLLTLVRVPPPPPTRPQ